MISLCGIPTIMPDGAPLYRDEASTQKIAREAVRWVYGHVGSPKDKNYVEQRKALAMRFRQKYRADQNGKSNVDAFFIGVFDTVASLGSYRTGFIVVAGLFAALFAAELRSLALFVSILAELRGAIRTSRRYRRCLVRRRSRSICCRGCRGIRSCKRCISRLGRCSFTISISTTPFGMRAMRCQSTRTVPTLRGCRGRAQRNSGPTRPDSYPDWLDQVWFAGNHSDIGGSYAENESRLSDIALDWMVRAAVNLPDGNGPSGMASRSMRNWLQLRPDPVGPQHDEREPGWLKKKLWPKGLRSIDHNAILHSSVYKRFAAEAVQHFYQMLPYRPENLASHDDVKQYYDTL